MVGEEVVEHGGLLLEAAVAGQLQLGALKVLAGVEHVLREENAQCNATMLVQPDKGIFSLGPDASQTIIKMLPM